MENIEGVSKSGGGVPDPGQFGSVGEWFTYLRSEGFSVPVQAPHAIRRAMDAFEMDPQEAFRWLVDRRLLAVMKGVVVVDLRATRVDLRTVGEDGLSWSQ
jgi:hypothetical protein